MKTVSCPFHMEANFGVKRYFQQYFSYIVAVRFTGGGNRSIQRKPLTCHKSLTNFITQWCNEYTLSWVGFELTVLVAFDHTNNFYRPLRLLHYKYAHLAVTSCLSYSYRIWLQCSVRPDFRPRWFRQSQGSRIQCNETVRKRCITTIGSGKTIRSG